jgi:hypothetical protein
LRRQYISPWDLGNKINAILALSVEFKNQMTNNSSSSFTFVFSSSLGYNIFILFSSVNNFQQTIILIQEFKNDHNNSLEQMNRQLALCQKLLILALYNNNNTTNIFIYNAPFQIMSKTQKGLTSSWKSNFKQVCLWLRSESRDVVARSSSGQRARPLH